MPRDEPVYLTEATARRVAEAVRWVERQKRDNPPGSRRPIVAGVQMLALTNSAITARSGARVGQGTALPVILSADGETLVKSGAQITLKNWTGSTFASGILVKYVVLYGYTFVDGEDCSGVAVSLAVGSPLSAVPSSGGGGG